MNTQTKRICKKLSFDSVKNIFLLSALSVCFCSCQVGSRKSSLLDEKTGPQSVPIAEDASTSEELPATSSLQRSLGDKPAVVDSPALPRSKKQNEIAQVSYMEPAQQRDLEQIIPDALPEIDEIPGNLVMPVQPALPNEFCPCPAPPAAGGAVRLHPMYPLELKQNHFAPDEYLCDGGDRNQPVKIGSDFSIKGLDLEDTVAHFDTLNGERHVQPSNSVCIYAPRFAAVRKTYGVALNRSSMRPAGTGEKVLLARQEDSFAATTTLQHAQPTGRVGSKSASSFIDTDRSETADSYVTAFGFHNSFEAYEDFQIIRFGTVDQGEKARLAIATQKAEFWSDEQTVQAFVKDQLAASATGRSKPQETSVAEEQPGKPKLRVIKVASKGAANPGDIVEFTIRFDNISSEKLGNLTLVDNLTPRLEYIPDSQECSLKADFLTTENEGESLLLRWEINDPLEKGQGGIIRFKCIVR